MIHDAETMEIALIMKCYSLLSYLI